MRNTVTAGLLALAMAWPMAAAANEDTELDPATIDLVKLIECQTYDVPAYTTFAFWLAGEDEAKARKHLGLTEAKSPNPFLKEYRLAAPITVFGRKTDRIVFTSSGPLAVLDEADPHVLAKALKIEPAIDIPGKYLGERVIAEKTEKLTAGSTFSTRITLNVSTVTSHPGKTLAGCSYRLDVE